MDRRLFSVASLLGIACALGPAPALHADDDRRDRRGGQEVAREAVRHGRYLPLERILADAERRYPGRVIEVELDDDEYEIEILLRDGRVAELVYDARSGRLLEVEIDDD